MEPFDIISLLIVVIGAMIASVLFVLLVDLYGWIFGKLYYKNPK